ncbi:MULTISPECIES: regulatory protein RecX [Halomonadaceae]|jgi:regulatory protein|uniref:Regulatory protein RecX n=1 Tax=Vreelandella piezotolerans TaxID=2609667 RepID=A0ABQ6XDT5_9GAMM|nr:MULTISPECIES: regulatory protein RecX [Halomonas]KFC51543.1 recombinase RecX [Halomonas sp. SUBG004]KAE8439732.1 regulatory protein RecX [Halomonas piezotolerans]MCG7575678.1 recombination regulator RecX [Halomonas sp. MMH1-48]MCG7602740.1 recombination regulator RecX [Halomonas sp. MM17-34]MCG7612221.1 recombination regulator RecX [Halomonas sp. MM17-29]
MFPSNADASPRDVAIQLLARREYSRVELARKLQQKSFDGDEIEACLDALAEQSLQSDARFAESFVRSRIARGQGVIRIKGELRQRGIDQETLTAALEAVEEREAIDWFELAKETLARRYDSPGDTPKERAKRERFLATRGFDFEQIRYALSCL